MGGAMALGGWRRQTQRFNCTAANVQSLMLLLACVALVMPATFQLVAGGGLPAPDAGAIDFGHDLEGMSL
jgi:Ca2+:H+ antiporter